MSFNPYEPPSYSQMPGFSPDPFEAAKEQLRIPAITILVMAAITAVVRVAGLAFTLMQMGQAQGQDMARLSGELGGNGAALLLNIATIAGSFKMMRAESYGAAMTAAIISVIPICSPCLVFGIPFGIWALVVLKKPEIKASFRP